MSTASQTGIAVTSKISLLAFLMLLFKPTVEIDGHAQQGAWSRVEFPTAAGQHSVTVFWKYLGFLTCNKATTNVTVTEGMTTEVAYQARFITFLPGKISVAQPAGTAG